MKFKASEKNGVVKLKITFDKETIKEIRKSIPKGVKKISTTEAVSTAVEKILNNYLSSEFLIPDMWAECFGNKK
jgi:hypothetical protein